MTGRRNVVFRHALAAVSAIVCVLGRGGGLIQLSDQRWARLAVVGTLVAALGLSACGRKGPLDPPPGAAQYSEPGPGPSQAPPVTQVGVGRDGKATAPSKSRDNRPFILDWLVD